MPEYDVKGKVSVERRRGPRQGGNFGCFVVVVLMMLFGFGFYDEEHGREETGNGLLVMGIIGLGIMAAISRIK